MRRGALVVFEGCDRSGKSTQCKKLVESMLEKGMKAELMRFPERSTVIGKLIDSYLKNSKDVQDNAIHLLFSANRWELKPEMERKLNEGVTLVVDRYAYSGVAFTAAKEGISLNWCKRPDVGLPLPDLVLFLKVSSEAAEKRGGFGEERYEKSEIQARVAKNFEKLQENDWEIINADQSMEDVQKQIQNVVSNLMNQDLPELGKLWTEQDSNLKM
ncbi:thymidylate kinase [Strongylocentrotus purpuratus]|uniref:Thymidylate kinase n=1 Tax=Strongylocentrotus purpuratus TaxID=7668 RepID=H3I5Q2_STRPU|nr:thymidylate kinase [Strongylocentrotus purpuratus]|eukprot:XP_784160.2 PREDICTED: thymidylate kinase [Strongylocentrotus purpuratus]